MAEKPSAEIARYEETGDQAALLRAAGLLEETDPRAAGNLAGRRELRRDTLHAWVSLLNIIDEKLDPEFDPGDLPELAIQPSATGGVQLPPGTDPAAIADPAARIAYQKAMEENLRGIRNYNLQHLLRSLEERASRAIATLVKESYLPIPYDRQELAAARDALRKPERRSMLGNAAER